jgi:HSP90 family molecular chaperone
MNARALRDSSASLSMQAKIPELNATHPAITCVTNQLEADEKCKTAKDMFSMLWDMALQSSGFSLSNASAFRVRINWMVAVAPDVVD